MTPKPPPPPPLPPAVPPDFVVIVEESSEAFEARVKELVAGGMKAQPNTMQLSSVAGAVMLTQAFVRDPDFDKRLRTRRSTQTVINIRGEA
jgi:hypothetical protein